MQLFTGMQYFFRLPARVLSLSPGNGNPFSLGPDSSPGKAGITRAG